MNQKIIDEIRNNASTYWENLVGVVMFGSCVKKRNYNDIDLLIVLENIERNRIERLSEVVEFKRTLNLKKSVDIILVSKDECLTNFRNHNPLYLDIALDGEIITDKGLLKKIMDETKEYITRKHVVREKTMWLFPVKKGVSMLFSIK